MRDWLSEVRSNLGLTLAQMGERLGISESYYLMIEQGKRQRKMDVALITKLSDVSGLSLDEIVKREEVWSKKEAM